MTLCSSRFTCWWTLTRYCTGSLLLLLNTPLLIRCLCQLTLTYIVICQLIKAYNSVCVSGQCKYALSVCLVHLHINLCTNSYNVHRSASRRYWFYHWIVISWYCWFSCLIQKCCPLNYFSRKSRGNHLFCSGIYFFSISELALRKVSWCVLGCVQCSCLWDDQCCCD